MNRRQRKKFLKANAMFGYELKSMQNATSSLYANLKYRRWYSDIDFRLVAFICPDCGTKSWCWAYDEVSADDPRCEYICHRCMHKFTKEQLYGDGNKA